MWAALGLITFSIAVAASARGELVNEQQRRIEQPAQVERLLRFEDRDDGAIVVIDHASGQVSTVLEANGHGFIRGVMRSMFRRRMLDTVGREHPFRLASEANGLLTLSDPTTGQVIDLQAFGSSNATAFSILLASPVGP